MPHWTENSVDDFAFRLTADFGREIQDAAEARNIVQDELDHESMTLAAMIRHARALGLKVTIVVYDDGDPANHNGPINPEIFSICWANAGKPKDFFELDEQTRAAPQTGRS